MSYHDTEKRTKNRNLSNSVENNIVVTTANSNCANLSPLIISV